MTTFTNSKLTDEYVSNATLIRLILWADQHNSHYVAAALRELQERRKADSVPVEINDDMAYAFHRALSDSSPGADEVEEIKAGLRAAFANVTTQPAPVVPEFETWFNSQESGRSICSTQIRRSLQEISWNACCAAMLQGKGDGILTNEDTKGDVQVRELTMLIKQLVSQLRKAKPDCKLPEKAMVYLKRNGLISAEDILR
ncbi:hypothetical protein [Escherichia coli]|uniref:hypothetical protein n=1 Tax=Escherichia TaxID=561 RepID=UPI0002A3CDF7|nr:hypothetical protein [Escherichia coli]MEC9684470.1 hypothetical protein [Escherichia marmotae]ELG86821.1 hypothetical protein A313_04506 [Escherichia coli KTE147]MCV8187890.1 hypothetical protein [Escherichia coli]MCV8231486.1 hypothetical protein [Escherichia coli]MCV8241237.1 hypothetical protein [Escherichia coli]